MYGTEYTREQINQALFSPDPYEIVPQRDELGHGTAMAGIACGSPDPSADFIGAAPQSSIIAVKLKPAKQYLRNYFVIPEDALAYQETDLMLGVRYLVDVSRTLQMPLIICMTLGSNQGGHTGNTPLEDVLTSAQFNTGVYAVSGTGNEVGQGHHYLGNVRITPVLLWSFGLMHRNFTVSALLLLLAKPSSQFSPAVSIPMSLTFFWNTAKFPSIMPWLKCSAAPKWQ